MVAPSENGSSPWPASSLDSGAHRGNTCAKSDRSGFMVGEIKPNVGNPLVHGVRWHTRSRFHEVKEPTLSCSVFAANGPAVGEHTLQIMKPSGPRSKRMPSIFLTRFIVTMSLLPSSGCPLRWKRASFPRLSFHEATKTEKMAQQRPVWPIAKSDCGSLKS
ncbi:uncharacterized protein BJX67DRAFT_123746 [Aspergillus lucknowensis]|uniref:Uncharacterized protein n=1 Tax=Aspergillus lucknowensis TaxID=176173 RepID=A0ABR4LQ72_9EURO